MRTEEDLRDAFDQLADQAPDPTDIRAALQPRSARRSRRTAPIIGTAVATACAAAAAVVVPQVIPHNGSDIATQDKRNSAWSHWLDLNLPKNIEVVGQNFSANRQDYEMFDVTQTTWVSYCWLQLHRNGDFNPATIPSGSPTIDLGGHQARVVTSTAGQPFMPGPRAYRFSLVARPDKTLAWQPAAGLWALFTCESQRHDTTDAPLAADLGLATSLAKSFAPRTGRLGSPIKLGDLPGGLAAREVKDSAAVPGDPGAGEEFALLLSDGNPATGYVAPARKPTGLVSGNAWDPVNGDDLSIRYDTSKFWNQMTTIRGGKADAVIHGIKTYYTPANIVYSKRDPAKVTLSGPVNTLRLEANGVAVVITSYGAKPSMEVLRRVAESVDLTKSPKNPDAWFDAATALP
jgi:hypothetical protein